MRSLIDDIPASKLNGFRRNFQQRYFQFRNVWKLRSNDYTQEANRILNQLTGYEECERLRLAVITAGQDFQKLKDDLRSSRTAFDIAIQSRSQCQKELNALLQRKQSWSDEDLLRFTELYRREMRLEQGEAEAKAANQQLEKAVDQAHQRLMDSLRERYQEEQLWSNKIRRLSTFGTFSLMGLNLLLFLIIQLWLEPRKRRKILGEFHETIDDRFVSMQERLKAEIKDIRHKEQPRREILSYQGPERMLNKLDVYQHATVLLPGVIAVSTGTFLFLALTKYLSIF